MSTGQGVVVIGVFAVGVWAFRLDKVLSSLLISLKNWRPGRTPPFSDRK